MGNGISRSVAGLEGGSPAEREAGARALADAACKPANRQSIADAGAIPPLVDLLGSGSGGAKEAAAEALANLASQTPSNAEAMVSAGCIPALIDLLSSGSIAAKAEAARGLTNIACNSPKRCQAIASAGAFRREGRGAAPSTNATDLPSSRRWDPTSSTPGKLLCPSPNPCRAGGIPLLVTLLGGRTGTPEQAAAIPAAAALANLAGEACIAQQIADAGAVPPLTALLGGGSSAPAQEQAVAALALLVLHHPVLGQAIISAGGIPSLVALLSSPWCAGDWQGGSWHGPGMSRRWNFRESGCRRLRMRWSIQCRATPLPMGEQVGGLDKWVPLRSLACL